MLRRVMILGLAVAAVVAAPVAAQQEYSGTVAAASVTGEVIVVTGEGFIPNATVNYAVDFVPSGGDENALVVGGYEGEVAFAASFAAPMEIVEIGTTTSDANGDVNFTVINRGEGRYTITMTDGVNTAVAGVTVTEGDGGGDGGEGDGDGGTSGGGGGAVGGDLPRTGSDSSVTLSKIGVAAVALGAMALFFASRRRKPEASG